MESPVAPFYRKVAQGPERIEARWIMARDGTRLRVAIWPEGDRGTVLLFPGRTEYIEKYGPAAAELRAQGFATASIDWRGQGLADRPLEDRCVGHVSRFADYQMDVAAMLDAISGIELPKPLYLLAHSMGGCIGLRALIEGLDVNAAVFSAPMWGIAIHRPLRPVAWSLAWTAHQLRFGHFYVPGANGGIYVQETSFERNLLTTDQEMYAFMQRQHAAHPDLSLGGPSLQWLYEALRECQALSRMHSPDVPAVTVLGSDEHVIDPSRIHRRMANWPDGRLVMLKGARHEPMMETQPLRNSFFACATEHFEAHP